MLELSWALSDEHLRQNTLPLLSVSSAEANTLAAKASNERVPAIIRDLFTLSYHEKLQGARQVKCSLWQHGTD